jgi:hypothetical protein
MSEDLITILGPQLYDTDTYNDYVARNHKNNDNWFKETLDLPQFGFRGTMQEFIIQGNKNSQQEENTKNITNNLGKEQGLDSQPNALKVLTQDVEGITRESPFAPSFDYTPEQLEAQRAQQVALTGPLPQQEAIFAFSGLPAVSSYVSKPAIDVSESERLSRDKSIGRDIATMSGFGEARFDANNNFIGGITDEKELLKFRTMRNFANAEAKRLENEEGIYVSDASQLAEMGINQAAFIDKTAKAHADGLIYDMTTITAINEGIITGTQALQREIYEDIQGIAQSGVGNAGIEYYLLKLNEFNPDLAAQVQLNPYAKPEGYDDVLELLDAKMLQDITEGEETIFDDKGEIIKDKKETPTTQELTQSDVLRREALKKKKSRSGLTEMETEELNRLEPTEIKAPPTNEELKIELEQLKRGKKTKAAKERIKEIETILAEGN